MMEETEEWLEIEERPNYLISNLGNVKRKSREFKNKFITIKGSVTNRGYRYLQLFKDDKQHKLNLTIHRCVAIAFIPNPDNLPCVDHIDNNPLNNNVNNLRWCSHQDNCKNHRQRTTNKKNGVTYDKQKERWSATCRENNKAKYLGCYDTYDEARIARENWEGDNEFYKKGNDENYSNVKGRAITRRPKGTGTIGYRTDNNKWRAVLIQEKKTILNKQFNTKEEAEHYLNEYLEK